MKKIYLHFVIGLFFLLFGTSRLSAQQVFKTTSSSVIGYLEYLPQGYDSNSDKYPIVFFLHGIGERGANTTDPAILSQSVLSVAKHGPPKLVKNGAQFPFILISPQLKNNYGTWTTAYILEVINHCKTYLRIDEKRIYLTGLSLGGGGTWVAAQDKPELFAAIAPVCGGYNSPSKACNLAGENLPVWAFHGDADGTVSYWKSVSMVNAINNCVPKPSPLALMTIYPGVGHNAWDYAYKNDNTLHTPNVYEWIMSYTNTRTKGNLIPSANAGNDLQISAGSTSSITGSGTDADGTISSYEWTKLSGPSVTLANPLTKTLSLSNKTEGEYVFRLKVTDNSGNTDSDYVKITVASNEAPVANAGTNQSITLPTNSLTIHGGGTDPDGSVSTYQWEKVSGGTAALANSSTPNLSVSSLAEGSYTFKLTITDNDGASDSDEMQVVVCAPSTPVVNAGHDKLVNLPTSSASITGSATDAGGSIVSYQWTKVAGGSCTLKATTSSTLKVSGLTTSGSYVFRLTATDNDGYSNTDDVTVTVNVKPIANAGADKSVVLPLSTPVYLYGTGSDADGTVTSYLWSKYSGPNVSLENNRAATLQINKMYEGTYVFKLQVTDNLGVKNFDYVTVTVSTAGTTSSSMEAEVESLGEDELSLMNESSSNFDKLSGLDLIFYDGYGKQRYNGKWDAAHDYQKLQQGLYIYNAFKDGVRVQSGKIYKK